MGSAVLSPNRILLVDGTATDADGNQGPVSVEVDFTGPGASDMIFWFGADAPTPPVGLTFEFMATTSGGLVDFELLGQPCTEIDVRIFGDGQQGESFLGVTDPDGRVAGTLNPPPSAAAWDLFAIQNGVLVANLNQKDT